jgi:AmmeMemoRadiSam system protein B
MNIRPCVYAGSFYPADSSSLLRMLELFFSRCDTHNIPAGASIYGIVSPHAGYVYSGQVAATAFCALAKPFTGTVIVIGPGHRTAHSAISACEWETPLGNLKSDEQTLYTLSKISGIAVNDQVHAGEHVIEVMLPFVKYQFPKAQIVAVQLGDQRLETSKELGKAISLSLKETKKVLGSDVYIVASSDGSHYVSHTKALEADTYALSALLNLDSDEFYRRVKQSTMCGYGPIIAMVTASLEFGAKQGICLSYKTSGEVTGDNTQVVGYAAMATISKGENTQGDLGGMEIKSKPRIQ